MPDLEIHYDQLGVSVDATQDEIRTAYRELIKVYHPDNNKTPQAEGIFNDIQLAHETLGDPQSRQEYDEELKWKYLGHQEDATYKDTKTKSKNESTSDSNESVNTNNEYEHEYEDSEDENFQVEHDNRTDDEIWEEFVIRWKGRIKKWAPIVIAFTLTFIVARISVRPLNEWFNDLYASLPRSFHTFPGSLGIANLLLVAIALALTLSFYYMIKFIIRGFIAGAEKENDEE